jgi:hypothetical protein
MMSAYSAGSGNKEACGRQHQGRVVRDIHNLRLDDWSWFGDINVAVEPHRPARKFVISNEARDPGFHRTILFF